MLSTAAANDEITTRATTLASESASFEDKAEALDADAPLIVPPPYFWAAVAIVVLIIVAILTGLWVVVDRAQTRQDELPAVLDDYPGTERCRPRAIRSRRRARGRDHRPRAAHRCGPRLFAVAEIVVLLVLYLSDRGGFGWLPAYSPAITNVSVFITATLATLLVGLVVAAYRDRQLRRVVAVLWDVITFWPRANHPLTPPCYAERTVSELLVRLGRSDRRREHPVVLAAHSQGSVIAAATLLQSDGETAHRVGAADVRVPAAAAVCAKLPGVLRNRCDPEAAATAAAPLDQPVGPQ